MVSAVCPTEMGPEICHARMVPALCHSRMVHDDLLQKSDAGDYECLVSNSAGTSTGLVTLQLECECVSRPFDYGVSLTALILLLCGQRGALMVYLYLF